MRMPSSSRTDAVDCFDGAGLPGGEEEKQDERATHGAIVLAGEKRGARPSSFVDGRLRTA
jgi:hypothetical protein